MRKEYSSCLTTFAAVAGLVFAVTSSAIAWGLSDADYDYLRKTHNLERYDHPVLDLSPRERSRIHDLITDLELPTIPPCGTRMSKTLSPCFSATSYGKKSISAKCGTNQGPRFQIDFLGSDALYSSFSKHCGSAWVCKQFLCWAVRLSSPFS